MEDLGESDWLPTYLTPLRNILTQYTHQPTIPHVKILLVFFCNLISDFILMLVCTSWMSFPSKLILTILASNLTALHTAHILTAPKHLSPVSPEFQICVFNWLIEISTHVSNRHFTQNWGITELLLSTSRWSPPIVFLSAKGSAILGVRDKNLLFFYPISGLSANSNGPISKTNPHTPLTTSTATILYK